MPDMVARARRICAECPEASFENVWHTLALLEMEPIERLNRSLTRGRATAIRRTQDPNSDGRPDGDEGAI